jgi:hypothetical protein
MKGPWPLHSSPEKENTDGRPFAKRGACFIDALWDEYLLYAESIGLSDAMTAVQSWYDANKNQRILRARSGAQNPAIFMPPGNAPCICRRHIG